MVNLRSSIDDVQTLLTSSPVGGLGGGGNFSGCCHWSRQGCQELGFGHLTLTPEWAGYWLMGEILHQITSHIIPFRKSSSFAITAWLPPWNFVIARDGWQRLQAPCVTRRGLENGYPFGTLRCRTFLGMARAELSGRPGYKENLGSPPGCRSSYELHNITLITS